MSRGHTFQAVAGESHYQPALEALLASGDREHNARLVPEPDNPYDKNAVAVFIGDDCIGYLDRGVARRFSKRLQGHASPIEVPAELKGGTEEKPSIGVVLDFQRVYETFPSKASKAPKPRKLQSQSVLSSPVADPARAATEKIPTEGPAPQKASSRPYVLVFILFVVSVLWLVLGRGQPSPRTPTTREDTGGPTAGTSLLCGPVTGKTPLDLKLLQTFCSKGLVPGTVTSASAMSSILWLKVSREFADAIRGDRLSAEQLVKGWLRIWRDLTTLRSVTVHVEWQDVEIITGDTTLTGEDRVTFR